MAQTLAHAATATRLKVRVAMACRPSSLPVLSGRYLYKPNLRDSCCPQYTIRMEANEFQASKHQRHIVNRLNHFVQDGEPGIESDIIARQNGSEGGAASTTTTPETTTKETTEAEETTSDATMAGKKQKQRKAKKNAPTDLISRIRSSEYLNWTDIKEWKHRFKVKLEPSSCTDEKYKLYKKYQQAVHHEPDGRVQVSGFQNFLVDTPLTATKEEDWTEEDPGFGSFHQCYYLDEKLIAVSVIDILPECVSAVYFFYDPDYSALSLGKYSAQKEIALAQTLGSKPGYEDLRYYYMGFYIFTCPKMTYKGHFHPSYLLDPETYQWIEFQKCEEIMKGKRYTAFEEPTPVNAIFEKKIQKIMSYKKGGPKPKSVDSDDEDDDWMSVNEDEEDEEDKKDEDEATPSKGGAEETNADHKRADKAMEREMEKTFKEITSQRRPGCLDPKEVTSEELAKVLLLTANYNLCPIMFTDTYKKHPSLHKEINEYVVHVGMELAEELVVYIR
ncbi:Arginyl-tRNA--protein transferase 1 [Lunasporangiospora selenospora]|uniref:Arginyl-tRNA--protein transferase 1 n=1 Tax=Lunasporangiospora selenospora TaxID=979761 RepID=A0A9P6KGQ4_9FUNG|nr:Arginyl-tRNA--protein transferase 1 [Lunasporangiospora selenospora]